MYLSSYISMKIGYFAHEIWQFQYRKSEHTRSLSPVITTATNREQLVHQKSLEFLSDFVVTALHPPSWHCCGAEYDSRSLVIFREACASNLPFVGLPSTVARLKGYGPRG